MSRTSNAKDIPSSTSPPSPPPESGWPADPIEPAEPGWPADPVQRAAAAAAAGLSFSLTGAADRRGPGDGPISTRGRPDPSSVQARLAELVAVDADPRVRAAALGALARLPDPPLDVWLGAAADSDASVRRRAADLAPAFRGRTAATLVGLLADREEAVAEAAAWALGELGPDAVEAGAVGRLAEVAGSHGDPLVREAAVAALGSLGDPAGLDAVLGACRDKPAIRRRAVLALAAFDGQAVDAALQAALGDKDWQTRQAAEDLLGP